MEKNGNKKLLKNNKQRLRELGIKAGDTIILEPKELQIKTNAFFSKDQQVFTDK